MTKEICECGHDYHYGGDGECLEPNCECKKFKAEKFVKFGRAMGKSTMPKNHSPQKQSVCLSKADEDKEPEDAVHGSLSGTDNSGSETLSDKYSEYYNGFQLKDVKEFIKDFDNIEVEGLDETCKRLMIKEIKKRAGKGLL